MVSGYLYVCVCVGGGCIGVWVCGRVDRCSGSQASRSGSQSGGLHWLELAIRGAWQAGRQAGRQLGVGMTWARDPAFSYSHGHSLFVMPHFATPPH